MPRQVLRDPLAQARIARRFAGPEASHPKPGYRIHAGGPRDTRSPQGELKPAHGVRVITWRFRLTRDDPT